MCFLGLKHLCAASPCPSRETEAWTQAPPPTRILRVEFRGKPLAEPPLFHVFTSLPATPVRPFSLPSHPSEKKGVVRHLDIDPLSQPLPLSKLPWRFRPSGWSLSDRPQITLPPQQLALRQMTLSTTFSSTAAADHQSGLSSSCRSQTRSPTVRRRVWLPSQVEAILRPPDCRLQLRPAHDGVESLLARKALAFPTRRLRRGRAALQQQCGHEPPTTTRAGLVRATAFHREIFP